MNTGNPPTQNSQNQTFGAAKATYRSKGKIAWLPKSVRDKINQLLLDGRTYVAILRELGPDGASLNINNLWRYHKALTAIGCANNSGSPKLAPKKNPLPSYFAAS